MARIAASCTLSGAGKSGWPMQKLMMSLPWRASALTSASTTKAFSVPRLLARRLISGIPIIMPSHADQLRRLPGRPKACGYRQAADQRLPEEAGLLRLGGAGRSDAGGAGRDAGGVRPARAGGGGRAPRPPAPEDRGIRRLAVRGAAYRRVHAHRRDQDR